MSTTYPIKDRLTLEQFKSYYLLKHNPRNYALIIVGLNTALRISDILMLRWRDVFYFERGIYRKHICIHEQKTGKVSMVAINSAAISALKILKEEKDKPGSTSKPEEFIFTSGKDKQQALSRYQAYRIVREAASFSGTGEHISCHSLRKTFGYFAWKQGVPPAMLMNIYNHSSYQITKRYLCIEQEDRDEVFMKINI